MTTTRKPLRCPTAVAALWLLLAATAARAVDLEVRLDRTAVEEGDSVRLLIRQKGSGSTAEPDLAPLQKDFEVLDVARSQRTQITNFHVEQSHDWVVTLAPQRTGRLQIPSLRVGDEQTEPLELEVAAAGSPPPRQGAPAAPSSAPAVFVEAEVDDPQPFVQERSVLTVRVHARGSVVEASLADPEIPGAIVERLGEDAHETRNERGASYDVTVRRYSVVPQQSGRLEIPPLVLEATVREAAPPRARGSFGDPFRGFFGGDPFGNMLPRAGAWFDGFFGGRTKRVRARSAALAIDVKPVPPGIALSQWLPARQLELREHYEPDSASVRVGEQVTRTVGIRAAGVTAVQLPDLTPPKVEGLKQYPEPPETSDREIAGELWSVKQQASVLVPTQPGRLVLPAIEVPWYDVASNEPRTAKLPERALEVLPAIGGAATTRPAPASEPAPATEAPAAASAPAAPAFDAHFDPKLLRVGGGALTLLVALSLFAWRRRLRSRRAETPVPGALAGVGERPRAAAAAFERACRSNDTRAAATALVAWGRATWPESPPNTPGEVAVRLGDATLRAEVDALNAVRYSAGVSDWRGESLLEAWRAARGRKVAGRARQEGPLPSLYPAR